MTTSPTTDRSRDHSPESRVREAFAAGYCLSDSRSKDSLDVSTHLSPTATPHTRSESASGIVQAQADAPKQPVRTSTLFAKEGSSDASPTDLWIMEHLDSQVAMLARRCDDLESRVGVLTKALYGDGCGFQHQIDGLQAKLRAAETGLKSDVLAAGATMASLAEGLRVCGQAHESLQSKITEIWRALALDHCGLAKQDSTANLAPQMHRLIEKVDKTYSELTSQMSSRTPSQQGRQVSGPTGTPAAMQALGPRLPAGFAAAERPAGSRPSSTSSRLSGSITVDSKQLGARPSPCPAFRSIAMDVQQRTMSARQLPGLAGSTTPSESGALEVKAMSAKQLPSGAATASDVGSLEAWQQGTAPTHGLAPSFAPAGQEAAPQGLQRVPSLVRCSPAQHPRGPASSPRQSLTRELPAGPPVDVAGAVLRQGSPAPSASPSSRSRAIRRTPSAGEGRECLAQQLGVRIEHCQGPPGRTPRSALNSAGRLLGTSSSDRLSMV
mmetsp:Transcript_50159/g.155013  ORF Transcript_50159/g.155013 Transcript_50159/m.155013 type:complete len:496 (+) Transcript_50159:94-1581(+)